MAIKSFENPLLPSKRLREMYTAMAAMRVLGESAVRPNSRLRTAPPTTSGSKRAAGSSRGPRIGFGLEACFAGTAIGLRDRAGDLVSEPGLGSMLDPVLGALQPADTRTSIKSVGRLAALGKPPERMQYALGAAMALKAAGRRQVVLAYVGEGDLTKAAWQALHATAFAGSLPIVFVVIPEPGVEFNTADLASSCKVPGIAVDASDAPAMYRVAQESIARASAGDGPALIAGVRFGESEGFADPLVFLGQQLVSRGVATQRWIDAVEPEVRRRFGSVPSGDV